jgi:hypothetical protein
MSSEATSDRIKIKDWTDGENTVEIFFSAEGTRLKVDGRYVTCHFFGKPSPKAKERGHRDLVYLESELQEFFEKKSVASRKRPKVPVIVVTQDGVVIPGTYTGLVTKGDDHGFRFQRSEDKKVVLFPQPVTVFQGDKTKEAVAFAQAITAQRAIMIEAQKAIKSAREISGGTFLKDTPYVSRYERSLEKIAKKEQEFLTDYLGIKES